ncbi:mucin TcMUCII [Trypanosoma cruzi]|nr:mucin TcMUCII [Trypanosoma cruzi]
MTCRLLCALLVLALCCCPSVSAADTQEAVQEPSKNTTTNGTTQAPNNTENTIPKADVDVSSRSSNSDSGVQVVGESGSPGTGHTAGHSNNNSPGTPVSTGPENQSNEVSNGRQSKVKNGAKEPPSPADPSSEKADQGAEDAAATTTTTTTTQVPTTTTTTAPEAPSTTTTTETPTATTTRAPSLLREVDSSLSSSAWVCAPLLLVVSALAYTAVG